MQDNSLKNILIYTDGACSGNPGPGGWGAIVAEPHGVVKELGGFAEHTTNNRMEMVSVIRALDLVQKKAGEISLFSDSTYVIRGITQWIWGWRKRNWVNAEGNEVSNKDLWQDLFSLVMDRGTENKINWQYSRGHVGTPGNERCDEIAVGFSQRKHVSLYEGSLLQYPIAIYDFPEDTSLPEMKPKKEKQQAYSYLSYLHGVVYRHWDWPACERRVKGQSGAKFKKALTADDEIKILEEWKVNPETDIQE